MQESSIKFLSDAEKAIVLKYFYMNPEMVDKSNSTDVLFTVLAQELNVFSEELHDKGFWLESIEFWKENIRENYSYAKNIGSLVSSYEDLELLILMRNTTLESKITARGRAEDDAQDAINCRTCLSAVDQGVSLSLFTSFVDNLSLGQLLNSCADIAPVVEHDGLPEMICFNCSKLLRCIYNFKVMCEHSDRQIRSTLSSAKRPEGSEEPELEGNVPDLFEDDTVSVYQVDYPYEEDFKELEDSLSAPAPHEDSLVVQAGMKAPESGQPEILRKTKRQKRPPDRHQKASFSNDRPHACEYCEKTFRTRLALKIHIRSHTGERPYVCETCGKGFKTISSINNHRAIHLSERQFQCPHCEYRASTKANLKIHHRTHTGVKPYTCHHCGSAFMTASNMQKHIRNIHKKLKTHKCFECGRGFFTKESATKHAVTHTGVKPYKCPECTLAYGWYNGLQKHMRIQHKGARVPKEKTFLEAMQGIREEQEEAPKK